VRSVAVIFVILAVELAKRLYIILYASDYSGKENYLLKKFNRREDFSRKEYIILLFIFLQFSVLLFGLLSNLFQVLGG